MRCSSAASLGPRLVTATAVAWVRRVLMNKSTRVAQSAAGTIQRSVGESHITHAAWATAGRAPTWAAITFRCLAHSRKSTFEGPVTTEPVAHALRPARKHDNRGVAELQAAGPVASVEKLVGGRVGVGRGARRLSR